MLSHCRLSYHGMHYFFFVLKSICAAAAAAFSICFFSSLKLICAVAAFSHSSLQYCCYLIQFDQFNGSEKISYSSRGGIGYGSSSTTTGRPGTGNPYASVHVRAIEPSPLLTDSGVVPVRAPPTTAGKERAPHPQPLAGEMDTLPLFLYTWPLDS
jgi:hypothetical protein